MNGQNHHPNDSKPELRITTGFSLWKMLMQGKMKAAKFSKAEAFYDLIDRQRISILTGDDDCLKGTIGDFVKTWGWDRDTVIRFLNTLEEQGVITTTVTDNRKSFRLNGVTIRDNVPGVL